MKFTEFDYTRPNFDEYKKTMGSLIEEMNGAACASEQIEVCKKIFAKLTHIES